MTPAPVGEGLVPFGRRALHRIGVRLAVVFLATAATAFALTGGRPGTMTTTLLAWALTGVAGGVAASRGPLPGAVTFAVGAAAVVAVGHAAGVPASPAPLVGALTYVVGASATHVLALRGFATTERALEALAAARAHEHVVAERWRDRREADRMLHDTVLATLSVLAHRGEGVPAAEVREQARRSAQALEGLLHDDPAPPAPRSPAPAQAGALREVLDRAADRAARLGLTCRTHAADGDVALEPSVRTALVGALEQCLDNVRRHAGVDDVDLSVAVREHRVVLVVTDRGTGFDVGEVAGHRLGLSGSVTERLATVGGSVRVHTRPGAGTSVVLDVPRGAAR